MGSNERGEKRMGNLTQDELDQQVTQGSEYLCKPGNRGFEFWLRSKGFTEKDEDYIRTALGY